ncbi:MAG: 50S ribosomal protein L11 methyltransferase [Pseudomonadota bacterium]
MSSKHLQNQLSAIIPGARLEITPLPEIPNLKLLLMNGDYPQGELDAAAVERVMDNPLYWVFCWASGRVLARHIQAFPDCVADRRVLDFGCGSGVVAIAAAQAGAKEVIACDIDPLALQATAYNAELNRVCLTLSDDFHQVPGQLDMIIAADVLYDRENMHWLARFADRAEQVLLADSRIKHFSHPSFTRLERRVSATLPDLDESEEFRQVNIYLGGRGNPSAY